MTRAESHNETPEDWLAGMVWGLTMMACMDVERVASHPQMAIHALRVRMKKLRAVLRLGEGAGMDLGGLHERCRDILKGVSQARDEVVMQKLYRKLFDEAAPWQIAQGKKGWSMARLRREVRQLERLAAGATYSGLTWARVAVNHADCLRRARKALKRCENSNDTGRFHTLRKRVKTLLYQSLALPESRKLRRRTKRAKALGKKLGREHDLAMLAKRLAQNGCESAQLEQVEQRRLRMHANLRKKGAVLLRR